VKEFDNEGRKEFRPMAFVHTMVDQANRGERSNACRRMNEIGRSNSIVNLVPMNVLRYVKELKVVKGKKRIC
jgi:hypothetical protein